MNRRSYNSLAGLLWLAPLTIAFRYWQLWDRLPLRMASHFDAAGRANGWMPRGASFNFSLGLLVVLAGIFWVVLYAIGKAYPLGKLSWALQGFFHVEIWVVIYMLNSTLAYNVDGRPISTTPLFYVTSIGLLAILAVALGEKRGTVLPASDVVAEEVHSGKPWVLLFLLPLAAIAITFITTPSTGARIATLPVAIVLLAVFAMAWDGFHYRFTRHGIEIRTLGFRLKSIPLLQIKKYEIDNWSPARGFGIRGIGNHKAYVWGKRGVRVEMYDGEIFLGHSDPPRIVHDLNVIKGQSQLEKQV
jgi:hypothetical protein